MKVRINGIGYTEIGEGASWVVECFPEKKVAWTFYTNEVITDVRFDSAIFHDKVGLGAISHNYDDVELVRIVAVLYHVRVFGNGSCS